MGLGLGLGCSCECWIQEKIGARAVLGQSVRVRVLRVLEQSVRERVCSLKHV